MRAPQRSKARYLQLSFESFVEDGGEKGIEFAAGLGLQALQRVHLCLQRVQLCHDPALLCRRDNRNSGIFDVFGMDVLIYSAMNPRSDSALKPWAAKIKTKEFGRVIGAESEPN